MQEQYREASDRFAALRNSLIDIIHEIDVLEELKEKQIKEFLKEVQRKEEKALEERINFHTFLRGGKMYETEGQKDPSCISNHLNIAYIRYFSDCL